jgi:hypothetical protein
VISLQAVDHNPEYISSRVDLQNGRDSCLKQYFPEAEGAPTPMLDAIAVQDLRAEFEELKPRVEELRRFL